MLSAGTSGLAYPRGTVTACGCSVLLFCAMLLPGCQSIPVSSAAWHDSETHLYWPPPPEQARIEYVGSIRANGPAGGHRGLASLLTGRESAAMVKPLGVAANGSGLVAVTDAGAANVHFFDLNKQTNWVLRRKLANTLESPVGVAVGKDGTAYVADSAQGVIHVFDSRAQNEMARLGEGILTRPTGVALDEEKGRLHVVDTSQCAVLTFGLDGSLLGRLGTRGAAPGDFNYPTYINLTPEGGFCVSDSLNFRVQVFTPEGSVKTVFGRVGDGAGSFARPKGVAMDAQGRVYVVDAAFENVQIFMPDGTLLLAFGNSGTGPGEFCLPSAIHIDREERIWVADSYNQRIQVFRLLPENGQ